MNTNHSNIQNFPLAAILRSRPQAVAYIDGGPLYPEISGLVRFYNTGSGVVVYATVSGLPEEERCGGGIFGFHIHEGTECTGNTDDPFSAAMSHYNPGKCPHPYHAGDLPPLFGCNGAAVSVFLTDRFTLDEIIGRVIIIHGKPDDFTSQPSGNSGVKLACGIINPTARSR